MPIVSQIITALQLIISLATIATLIYGFAKFAGSPNRTQDERLDILERWKEKVDERLLTGDEHFKAVDEGNKITQKALLALMKHSINGNDIDKLKEAEHDLENYLVGK